MESLSVHFLQRLPVFLLTLLLNINPSLAYSLKNCTIIYSDNPLDDASVDCSDCRHVTVPDDIPRDVTSITLLQNLIENIRKEDFENLSKLRILVLSFNEISHVEDGSFSHLTSLTFLNINHNKLTNLTANLFEGLSNLTRLDLGNNIIQFIHTSAFQFLTSLQTVIIDSNHLKKITDIQPILQLPHLQELSISFNLFSSFETKDLLLNVSSSLKVLDVSHNNLKSFSITTPIFPQLEMIDLTRCGQTGGMRWDIPDRTLLKNLTQLVFGTTLIPFEVIRNVLQNLNSLMHLRLNYMKRWINKGLLATVCKIPTLRRLDLFWNKVPNLGTKLVTCSQLTDLNLSYNEMPELSKGSIRSMKMLRSLKMENNLLTKVPEDIRSLSSLEILNLGDNLISDLDCKDFINTTSLTELYLNISHITKLDSCVFENLNNLKVLDLSHNLLWTIGEAFKIGPAVLEVLDLSNNLIPFYGKGDFKGLGSLKYLNLASDTIEGLESTVFEGMNKLGSLTVSLPFDFQYVFKGLQNLENFEIYLKIPFGPHSYNFEAFRHLKSLKVFTVILSGHHFAFPLDILPQTLHAMRHLESFTAENVFNSVPDPYTFQFNPHLNNLTIRKTDLSDLDPELFRPIPKLQVLDFSNCKLKSLDFLAQANLSALRYLKLTDNEIIVINETVFQSLPALTYLELDNNPFTCDCSNARFIQWVKSNNQTQVVNACC
ncbi:hypothetical protein Q5P01_018865 [Channa striata]|uniref:Uncharacterized protein n=1 Tax=Channa striata TaxID=64152 RepID=A0AA88SGE3_CHASR|nr:hypothetical protein Q5P01_018865 [Channa striata]